MLVIYFSELNSSPMDYPGKACLYLTQHALHLSVLTYKGWSGQPLLYLVSGYFYYVCNYAVGHYVCILSTMSTCKCVCDYMCIHIQLLICAKYMNDNTIHNNPRAHGQNLGSCIPPLSIMKWAHSLCNYVGTWHYTGGGWVRGRRIYGERQDITEP